MPENSLKFWSRVEMDTTQYGFFGATNRATSVLFFGPIIVLAIVLDVCRPALEKPVRINIYKNIIHTQFIQNIKMGEKLVENNKY